MSIHYLLDGYNVIHQMPSVLNLAKLEDRRRRLIRFMEQNTPQGSPNNRVTGNPQAGIQEGGRQRGTNAGAHEQHQLGRLVPLMLCGRDAQARAVGQSGMDRQKHIGHKTPSSVWDLR